MNSPLFIPIDLREDFIGGLLRVSKKHFEWKLELDKTVYSIELECSYLTNKRRVYLQRQLVSKGVKYVLNRAVGQAFRFSFPIEKHVATVRNSGTEADLVIDNVSFRGLYYAGVQAYAGNEAHEIQIEGPRDPYLSKLWSMTPEQRQEEHKNRVEQIQKSYGLEKPQDLLTMDTVEQVTSQTKQQDFLDFEQVGEEKKTDLPGPVKPSMEALFALDPTPNAKPARLEQQPELLDLPEPQAGDLLGFATAQSFSLLEDSAPPAPPQPSLNLLDFGSDQLLFSAPKPHTDLFPVTQKPEDLFSAPAPKPQSSKSKEEAEFDKLFS